MGVRTEKLSNSRWPEVSGEGAAVQEVGGAQVGLDVQAEAQQPPGILVRQLPGEHRLGVSTALWVYLACGCRH